MKKDLFRVFASQLSVVSQNQRTLERVSKKELEVSAGRLINDAPSSWHFAFLLPWHKFSHQWYEFYHISTDTNSVLTKSSQHCREIYSLSADYPLISAH